MSAAQDGDAARLRLLYFVGAGPAAKDRVDIAHLFGEVLGPTGIEIDWYLRTTTRGGPVMKGHFHGRPARLCGRAAWPGLAGRVVTKLQELAATLHFAFAALAGDHDMIQVRDDFVAAPLGMLAARLRRRPFVFWLSYPFPESRMLDAREGRARWPWYARLSGAVSGWMLYQCILPWADHVFVQSEQMKRDVLRPGVDPNRLTPVPMGLPARDVPPAAPPSDEPLVLYLGTLARVRRLTMIVDAFAQVHRAVPLARLAIVGEGNSPEDRAELESAAAQLGLGGVVTFTGALRRDAALDWVRRSAVCLSPFYPSFVLRSTSPTKLIEYMAMGKAVVANDHPEQSSVLAASGAGTCVGWDADAFAKATIDLLSDPARRARAGKAGREWVVAHRLYPRIAADVLAVYRRLARPAAAASAGGR